MLKRIIAASMVSTGIVEGMNLLTGLENEKRYEQLLSTMQEANSAFTADKFWAYGCNCQLAQSIDEPSRGSPKDALDSACKRYKDCIRCAAMEFGEECPNEFVKYRIRKQGSGLSCKDNSGTCKRALCECDKMFAELHAAVADQYDQQFHTFDGGFETADECAPNPPKPTQNPTDIQCCGPNQGPKQPFNANSNKKCCADGTIKTDCEVTTEYVTTTEEPAGNGY